MPDPGGIITLDLSLSTGWAYGCVRDSNPISGVWVLPSQARNSAAPYVALENELEDAIARYRPHQVVCATPLLAKRQTTHRLLIGLTITTESCCYRQGIDYREQAEQTIRKAVLGRASFPRGQMKVAVLDWCRARGWNLDNDDEADARVVWQYAVDLVRNTPRPRGRNASQELPA